MSGRGPQTFQKRLKEQQRKEKQQEKMAKRLERKRQPESSSDTSTREGETESGSELRNRSKKERRSPHGPGPSNFGLFRPLRAVLRSRFEKRPRRPKITRRSCGVTTSSGPKCPASSKCSTKTPM